ncbi:MAG: protein kinase [Labilithrix sp.]|nr:protein kinase [Labilithrix sp.]
MAATYSSLVGLAVGGKYEIRRVLGAGGMGVVCEAVHLDLGKRVAVKLIDKTMKESELIVARFRREARAAGQINSEHIVDVFDVGADGRVGLYMVMEHLTGEDLQGRLERDKRIDVKTGVMIAHQIARGLVKAHEAGVIHRDLKPANVYLTERDNGQMLVKLLDFGVSKLLGDAPGSARITGSGTPIGTPLYMSPEQAEGKDDVDGRADIWSLGAVLYEALAGAAPFADRGSYHGTIVGILTSRPKLLHDAAPWVPPELASVVDAMLVHDRDARIPSAEAVTQRLLDAFPTVLPDGTGKHTAVIVPQAAAAVDATGDTEVFTAGALAAARASRPSAPGGGAQATNRVSGPPRSEQDSTKTIPDSNDASRTGTATPVDLRAEADRSSRRIGESGAVARSVPTTGGSGPKTAPLPPTSRPDASPAQSSSAGGVALPATPPEIDPLPVSELAPNTERDDQIALRADRRRRMTLASIVLAIVGVAVGGFIAGQRAQPNAPAPSAATSLGAGPVAAPPVTPTTATPTTATATPTPAATAAAIPPDTTAAPTAPEATEPTAPAVSPADLPSPSAAPVARPRKARPKPPAAKPGAPAAEDESPAPAPPPAPTPAPEAPEE